MSATRSAPIQRILLAFDAVAHSPTALESVVALAARLDAELLGLFIEDINLLRFAGLPFAREIGLTSATARPLRNPDMERALRVQAARAEAALAREAGRLKLRWSFRVTRGQLVTQVTEPALETDLVDYYPGGRCAGARTLDGQRGRGGAARRTAARTACPAVRWFSGGATCIVVRRAAGARRRQHRDRQNSAYSAC